MMMRLSLPHKRITSLPCKELPVRPSDRADTSSQFVPQPRAKLGNISGGKHRRRGFCRVDILPVRKQVIHIRNHRIHSGPEVATPYLYGEKWLQMPGDCGAFRCSNLTLRSPSENHLQVHISNTLCRIFISYTLSFLILWVRSRIGTVFFGPR